LLIFGGCIGPPKITLNTFGGRALAVENNVFSMVKARPPKINFYFWLFLQQEAAENNLFSTAEGCRRLLATKNACSWYSDISHLVR
jgi:hypothetical protein